VLPLLGERGFEALNDVNGSLKDRGAEFTVSQRGALPVQSGDGERNSDTDRDLVTFEVD
jgi:hypothetical protein